MGRKPKEDKIEEGDIELSKEEHPATFNGFSLLTPELQFAISQIEKAHGEGAIMSLGSYKATSPVKRISSGSISLDSVLGGGFVFGKIVELFGMEGVGKTTMMLEILARAQTLGLRCAFIDMEHNLNPSYAIALGVDLDKVLIAQPASGEEALDIAEKLFAAKIDIVFLDSVAALNSIRDLEKDITENAVMASKAALLTRFFERNQDVIAKNNILFVCSNQQRAKINAMHPGSKGTPGGYALKYWASIRLEMSYSEKLKDPSGFVYGQLMHIQAVKNKFNAPFKETLVTLVYGKGIDKLKNWIEVAAEIGIIQKGGAWFNYGEVKLGQGIENSKEFLQSNLPILEEIKTKTLEVVGANWGPEGKA